MVNHGIASRIIELGKQQKAIREIATTVGVSKSTVSNVLRKAPAAAAQATQPSESPQAPVLPPIHPAEAPDALNEISLVISEDRASQFLEDIHSKAPQDPPDATTAATVPELKSAAKKEAFINSFLESVVPPAPPAKAPRASKAAPRAARSVKQAPSLLTPFREEEDAEEKATLISTITMNVNAFEPLLKDLLKPSKDEFLTSLRRKSAAELAVTLKILEHTRTVGNISNQMRHLLYMGAMGVEVASSRFLSLKSQGFAVALRTQDEEIRMILREICMERVESLKKIQRPELRLGMLMATTLLAVDSQNRMGAAAAPTPTRGVVAPEVEAKFGDL